LKCGRDDPQESIHALVREHLYGFNGSWSATSLKSMPKEELGNLKDQVTALIGIDGNKKISIRDQLENLDTLVILVWTDNGENPSYRIEVSKDQKAKIKVVNLNE
jgi:hypothetical protein